MGLETLIAGVTAGLSGATVGSVAGAVGIAEGIGLTIGSTLATLSSPLVTTVGILGQATTGIIGGIQDASAAEQIAKLQAKSIKEKAASDARALGRTVSSTLAQQSSSFGSGNVVIGTGSSKTLTLETIREARLQFEDILLGKGNLLSSNRVIQDLRVSRARRSAFSSATGGLLGIGTLATRLKKRIP